MKTIVTLQYNDAFDTLRFELRFGDNIILIHNSLDGKAQVYLTIEQANDLFLQLCEQLILAQKAGYELPTPNDITETKR